MVLVLKFLYFLSIYDYQKFILKLIMPEELNNLGILFLNSFTIRPYLILFRFMYNASLYAALLLGYTIHFIYCIWGNLRITVAELIAA